ncbi:hypothetical protein PIB30_054495 [Stylosanthes scabra]|uniref:Uncharacterized protein n=1 Tax=Stylosanthes scabra TaxID=79078 RepID=A0ABU6RJA3_9FABA|nr:hypothetical protein [Stylosanthes scabra]
MDASSSPCTTSSPEFEFWMLRNPSFPQPNLHSADELFVDGVLLPLHLLPSTSKLDPPPDPEQTTTSRDPEPESSPAIITEYSTSSSSSSSSTATTLSTSKRWKDIFKKKNTENNDTEEKEKEKEKGKKKKKKEVKKTGGGSGSAAELNINIWPFSRSRSAGNAVTRPKLFAGRKVNSAPCSRSNSTGDSKSRKWPSSPGRPGVHVGRTSPVWQVRRNKNNNNPATHVVAQNNNGAEAKKRETATCQRSKAAAGRTKARVLNLNVPMCIGYRQPLSCRSDENGGAVCGTANGRGGDNNDGGEGSNNDGGSGVNLFNLRNLFTKKSIVTSH